MIVTQDERTAARFEASYPVQIEANGRPIPGRSLNMGIGGLCLEPGASLPDHTPVVCRLDAEGKPLEAQGEVAWQYAEEGVYRMGIRFCALSPAMAGWLSSVTTSHAAIAQEHAPLSDTQPMKVPVVPEDLEPAALAAPSEPEPEAAPEPTAHHEAAAKAAHVEQLDLWKKAAAAAQGGEAVETDVLFDDMPSPEARMMQTKADAQSVEAMSAKHRLFAMARGVRAKLLVIGGRVAAPVARLRARRGAASRTATTQRIQAERPRATAVAPEKVLPSRLRLAVLLAFARTLPGRVPAVAKHLHNRRVQLVLAAVGVTLLLGSGLAFMFAGGEQAPEGDATVAELPAAADNGGSYWDPPTMPVPDQEIAEAAPAPLPEPVQAAPTPPPAVAIPDMPLPEPPVVGAGAEGEAPSPEPVAAADVPPELPAPAAVPERAAEADAEEGAAEAAGTQARERRSARRTERAERSTRAEAPRAAREHARTAAREEPAPARQRSESARGRHEEEQRPAPERAERNARRTDARTAAAAPSGQTTFRLNLSGAPGAIHTYPLANPNGIVIDVANLQHPGEATKLTSDDPRIRFVKIINREQGVRFIVYLTGDLPEYQVEPSGRGVRVALR